MLVDSAIALLGLQFSDVLAAITAPVAPCDVDRIFRTAVGSLSDFVSFSAGSVVERAGVYHVGAAFSVGPAHAGCTSSSSRGVVLGSDDFAVRKSCLA